MKKELLYLLTVFFLINFTVPTLTAQNTLSFGMTHSRPLLDLQNAEYRPGYGFAMEIFSDNLSYRLPVDLQLGGHFDVNVNGERTFNSNPGGRFSESIESTFSNQSASLAGVARLITPNSRFRVYLDGMMGSRVYYTTLAVEFPEDHALYDPDHCSSEVINQSWTFMYGGSAGFLVQITPTARLDFRATYSRGSNAGFVNLNSISQVEENIFDFKTDRTATDLLQFQIGINYDIIGCGNGASSIVPSSEIY